jgi:ribosomal-protein-serine acetyltransferase
MLPRVLETPRLRLEATVAAHAPGLWSAILASLPELTRFMAWAPTASAENTVTFAERMQKRWDELTDWSFTILLGEETAGNISLMGYEPLADLAEIGYWLRSDLCGRGLMTEAARAVVGFAFDKVGCHRLELRAAESNPASIRVAEKLGFVREGTLREANRAPDGRYNMHIYGLLAHERTRTGPD